MEIKDKRVVVTGAASGIGKALCIAFKESGAKSIVCVDINIEGAIETANLVKGIAVSADVSKESDIIWGVNVQSHIYAAKHVLPQMMERGEGYLVNTSSAAGLLTQLGAAGYSVTKAAAVSFAEWIKITYGNKGIGVSCLCPQAVRTAMTEQGPGVAGVDGMLEADVVANDVLNAIREERFLVLPHPEVAEYMQRKANDRDRWIGGMQRLQKQYEDFLTHMNDK